MRLLAGTAVLIGVIIILAAFMSFKTVDLSNELLSNLHFLEQKVDQEEWVEAAREVKALNKLWNRADAWWAPFMGKQETELLNMSIVRVAGWVDTRNRENALVEIGVTKRIVQGVKGEEKLNIKNIF